VMMMTMMMMTIIIMMVIIPYNYIKYDTRTEINVVDYVVDDLNSGNLFW
jgi:cell division protein FtsL